MKKLLLFSVFLILNFNLFASGLNQKNLSDQDKEIFNAMETEMQRNLKNLKMENFPAPYFISYKIVPYTKYIFGANQGVLTRSSKVFYPEHAVQVRVGSKKEDNSFFVPAVRLAQKDELVFPLNYEGLRKALWQITDGVYKNALAQLTEKQAYKKNKHIADKSDNFSFYPAKEFFDRVQEPAVDESYWQQIAKRTSAKGVYEQLEEFKTAISITFMPSYFLTSRGSKYLQDRYSVQIVFMAKGRLEDGFEFNLDKTLTYADFKDVPSPEELEEQATAFAKEVLKLQKAKKAQAYIGPVLLEGAQAAELMEVLQREISYVNPVYSNMEEVSWEGAFTDKIGLKILSSGFDVIDDPLRKTFGSQKLAGYYEIDEEGVEAEKIQIVENGLLKTLPYGASLTKNNTKSNGHARIYFRFSGVFSAPSNLILLARKTVPQEEFVEKFRVFCAEQGLKACPIIKASDGKTFFGMMLDSQSAQQTPVYGELMPFNTRSLRDIKYASDNMRVYNNITSQNGFSIVVPDLILDNGEISPSKKQPARKPLIAKP